MQGGSTRLVPVTAGGFSLALCRSAREDRTLNSGRTAISRADSLLCNRFLTDPVGSAVPSTHEREGFGKDQELPCASKGRACVR